VRKWKRVDTADGPRFRSQLPPHEAALLKKMLESIQEMLDDRNSAAPSDPLEQITGIRTGNTAPPEDATMRRLLPDFFRPEDQKSAGSADAASLNSALRSLHEPDIIDAKRAAVQRVLETLPEDGSPFEITESDANAWVAAVNDIRLALGTMLDIGPDGPDELPEGHPMAGHLDVYQWLTVLQEYLVLGLMSKPIR
jgi:hypothetical protein